MPYALRSTVTTQRSSFRRNWPAVVTQVESLALSPPAAGRLLQTKKTPNVVNGCGTVTAVMPSFRKQRAIIEQDQQTLGGGNRNAWFILQCIVDPKVLDMISSLPRWWKEKNMFFPSHWAAVTVACFENDKKKVLKLFLRGAFILKFH